MLTAFFFFFLQLWSSGDLMLAAPWLGQRLVHSSADSGLQYEPYLSFALPTTSSSPSRHRHVFFPFFSFSVPWLSAGQQPPVAVWPLLPEARATRASQRPMSIIAVDAGSFLASDSRSLIAFSVPTLNNAPNFALALGAIQLGPPGMVVMDDTRTAYAADNTVPALLFAATHRSWSATVADDSDRPLTASYLRLVTRWRLLLLISQALRSLATEADLDLGQQRQQVREKLYRALDAELASSRLTIADGADSIEQFFDYCPHLQALVNVEQRETGLSASAPRCTLGFARAALQECGLAASLASEASSSPSPATWVQDLWPLLDNQEKVALRRQIQRLVAEAIQVLATCAYSESLASGGAPPDGGRTHVVEAILKEPIMALRHCGEWRERVNDAHQTFRQQ